MASRLPNPRKAKIHRSYTVEEVAQLYGVHRNTVRAWLKQGLPTCDDKRPLLILGRDLAEFLTAKRTKNKQPCKPGEIYCVGCKLPRVPVMQMADFQPLTPTTGNLIGICPDCERLMYRRVSTARLDVASGNLDVLFVREKEHINERCKSSVNCDFNSGA